MPILSVLIPTYNRRKCLKEALDSLIYLGGGLEVIVGNNGEPEPVNLAIADASIDVPVEHLQNPEGSTYPDNLKSLISRASGQWLTILHDDDFFMQEARLIPGLLAGLDREDFVFSDHWIADSEGEILPRHTDLNSEKYGRTGLSRGPVQNLEYLAVKQGICLDCFFVRTELARACEIDTSLKCFADVLLLAQIASRSRGAMYLPDRLFAYRLSSAGLTSQGFLQDELLRVLLRIRRLVSTGSAKAALAERIRRQAYVVLKYSIKRRKLHSFVLSLKTLAGFPDQRKP